MTDKKEAINIKNHSCCRDIGLMLLLALTFAYLIDAIGYALRIENFLQYVFPLSVCLSALITRHILKSPKFYISVLWTLAIVFVSTAVSALFPDYSWDGNNYHQHTITALVNGWNPYHEPTASDNISIWSYHYAKCIEILATNIIAITGNIETGKAVNLILIFAAGALCFDAIKTFAPDSSKTSRLIFTILVAGNPVGIMQFMSYYIDYAFYYCLVIDIIAAVFMLKSGSFNTLLAWMMLACATILTIGTKFNAFFLQGVFFLAFIIYMPLKREFKLSGTISLYGFGLALTGILVSFHPYVTNYLWKGSPLYPLIGADGMEGIDIMTGNTPELYKGHGRLTNFLLSIFSVTIPNSDSRIGGFTPMFAILFPVSLIIISVAWYKSIKHRAEMPAAVYISVCVLLSCFIFKESWWARYNTQLWLIVPSAYYVLMKSGFKPLVAKWGKTMLATLGLMAMVLCMSFSVFMSVRLAIYRHYLFSIAERHDEVLVNPVYNSGIMMLRSNGINPVSADNDSIQGMKFISIYPVGTDNDIYFLRVALTDEEVQELKEDLKRKPLGYINYKHLVE